LPTLHKTITTGIGDKKGFFCGFIELTLSIINNDLGDIIEIVPGAGSAPFFYTEINDDYCADDGGA